MPSRDWPEVCRLSSPNKQELRESPTMQRINRRRSRRGSTTVETALALPILFMIIFAGWEFSRINVIRNTMGNAAYEGARESMLPGATVTKSEDRAQEVLDAVGITGGTVTVSPNPITNTTTQVTVDISVPIVQNSLGVAQFFSSGNMTSTVTLNRELQPGQF